VEVVDEGSSRPAGQQGREVELHQVPGRQGRQGDQALRAAGRTGQAGQGYRGGAGRLALRRQCAWVACAAAFSGAVNICWNASAIGAAALIAAPTMAAPGDAAAELSALSCGARRITSAPAFAEAPISSCQ